jgi:hypothetical protein
VRKDGERYCKSEAARGTYAKCGDLEAFPLGHEDLLAHLSMCLHGCSIKRALARLASLQHHRARELLRDLMWA